MAVGGPSFPWRDTVLWMEDWLRRAAQLAPERAFLMHPDSPPTTYAEMEHRVQLVVAGLEATGIRPGHLVGVMPRNDVDSTARLFAVPRTGAAAVVINARLTTSEVGAQLSRARASHAFDGLGGLEGVQEASSPSATVTVDADRDHSILFTSGSTASAKPVRLTWGNLEASAAGSAELLHHTAEDRWLAVLPIYHIGGMSILIRSARQMSSVVLEPRFDPVRAAQLMASGNVTLGSLVSAMLRQILDADPGPYRDVRALLIGGGPTPSGLLAEAVDAGLPVLPTYGMTETASQIATRRLSDGLHPGMTAVPVPGAEIRTDRDGVIEVKGAMVSPGYLGEPDRRSEWFRTSDVGELRDGQLTVLGRVDDVIVSGGENIHPVEVEAVLRAVDAVRDVVVVGAPHDHWGEEVVAVVEGDAAPGALERHARYHLAGYKIPKRWMKVDELPRLSIGKPDRRAVRAMVVRGSDKPTD